MKYAIDVSNYSGEPTLDALRELANSERIERIAIGCQFPDTYAAWYDLAAGLGLEIHAWLYLYEPETWGGSIYDAADGPLRDRPPTRIWLDIEDTRWPVDAAAVDLALNVCDDLEIPHGIYTAPGLWAAYGNPQAGQRCPLWLAKWIDREPAESDFDVGFGGWDRASMVQYRADYTTYGLTVDMNVYE